MTVPKATVWEISPHTAAKHQILGAYLDAWLPIMSSHNGRIVFIDGFAGPGRYKGGEPGSPIIALERLLSHSYLKKRPDPFRKFYFRFIEERSDRAKMLAEEIKELLENQPAPCEVAYRISQGTFASEAEKLLDEVDQQGRRKAAIFAFIDPFGFSGVPMELIGRLGNRPRCECLISFMFESVNRFLQHPEPAIEAHYDELFGTTTWKDLLQVTDRPQRRTAIVELYRDQLVASGLKYVRPFEMINKGNQTQYFLYFGTNSKRGLSKMKEAMWKAAPLSGAAFSDRADGQLVLLDSGTAIDLETELVARFSGQGWISVEGLQDFTLLETAYSEVIHLKKRTLKPMEIASPPRIEVRGRKRDIRGQYPAGCEVRFL